MTRRRKRLAPKQIIHRLRDAGAMFSAMSSGTKVIAATAGLLVATASVLLLNGGGSSGGERVAARHFQRMAGGLGLGATVRPRWCFVNFDPRIEHCTCMEQPLPGGYCYCPEHTGTVSFFVVHRASVLRAGEEGISGP